VDNSLDELLKKSDNKLNNKNLIKVKKKKRGLK